MDDYKKQNAFEKIISALSSPVRVKILLLLSQHKNLPFSSVFNLLSKEVKKSSNLAYHLKYLISSGLVKYNKETRSYSISQLGNSTVSFLQYLSKRVTKSDALQVLDLKDNLLIPFLQYLNLFSSKYNLTLNQSFILDVLKDLEKHDESLISSEIADIFLFSKLLDLQQISVDKISSLLLEKKLRTLLDKSIDSHITYSGYQFLNNFFAISSKENFLFDFVARDSIFIAHLKQGDIFIDKHSSFIIPRYYILYGPNLTAFLKKELEKANGLSSFLSGFLLLLSSYPYSTMFTTVDNFNYYLSRYSGEYSEFELKRVFLEFFDKLSSFSYLFSNLSIELTLLSESYLKRKLPASLSNLYDEYYDEIVKVSKALIESYIQRQKLEPSLNPHISIKLDEHSLENSQYLEIVETLLKEIFSAPLNVSFSNASAEWHDKFSYGFHGELYEFDASLLDKGVPGIVGINLFSLAKSSSYNENIFKENLQRITENVLVFLQKVDDKLVHTFPSKILYHYPLGQRKYQRLYTIALVGLNEATKMITGSYPWNDEQSLNFLYSLLTFINRLVEEARGNLSVNTTNIYPFSDIWPLLSSERTNILSSSTSVYHGLLSFRKALNIESLIHPHLRGGHRFVLRLSSEVPISSLNEVLAQLFKSSVGSLTFSYPTTYCEMCSGWYIREPHLCRRCNTNTYLKPMINLNGIWEQVDEKVKNKLKISKGYTKRTL